jgi:hypothetical protein
MQRMRAYWSGLGVALLVIISLFSLAACADQESTPPMTNSHVAALLKLPPYQLVYPGSVLISQGASPPSSTIDGSQGATAGKLYGMEAPVPAGVTGRGILAWYHQQLAALGWRFVPTANVGSYEVREYWNDGQRYYCNIGIYSRTMLKWYLPSVDANKYPILFDVSVGE